MNGDWLIPGSDGRLGVYHPTGDGVLSRAELRPGGGWTAPRRVGGELRLRPGLGVGQGTDGYAHLVSWRPAAKDEAVLTHSTHYRPDLTALDWAPIGHPNRKGPRTSDPAVAVDAQGRAHVFVVNGGQGLSMVAQREKGGWDPWRDLKGSRVQDGLAALTGESGLVEVYGAVPGGILHWSQEKPGGQPSVTERLEARVRPGTLAALATSADRTTVFYTDPEGLLCAWRPGSEPVALLYAAGPGPVSAARCLLDGHDCTVLAQRAANGRVAIAAYPTEAESAGAWWAESGPELPEDARVFLTGGADSGRLVAAALSPSAGRLVLTRRKDEPGLALEPWREI
ncbi:hypothetical protein ACFWN1_28200 [Streptomyces sp. NPDC058459]|uniref:hypothetical protein n=1 Tax=Streptomyces sp. NPDC058459 TaxID=3346508 RepID=UPI0036581AB1